METPIECSPPVSAGADIITRASKAKLDTSHLYEAVIDLSSEGLMTANCINRAAGILLSDLGLPDYFFETITKESLKNILAAIAKSIDIKKESVSLHPWVADISFDLSQGGRAQHVRIATQTTRDKMEKLLGSQLSGHRREYYYNPDSEYYTHIFTPETVADYDRDKFKASRFLFSLDADYNATPKLTRDRYEKVLEKVSQSVIPVIEVFNLSDIGETRFMFNSDFERPQIGVLRKLFSDHGLTITRAYWEPYFTPSGVVSSINSLYVQGELSRRQEEELLDDLRAYLSFPVSDITRLYVNGSLSFREMLFAGNAVDFVHLFIFKEKGTRTDREIMKSLSSQDHQEAFSQRIHESNKFTYVYRMVMDAAGSHPDLIRFLYRLFDRKFNPATPSDVSDKVLETEKKQFSSILDARFIEHPMAHDLFSFMFKFLEAVSKTNFYKPEKRAFCFRLDDTILDPMVFKQPVFGIFFVNGHYACGTHMRAEDIARGGLRLIRVTPANHARELGNSVLLNYALGPKAQRLKHKDICESGSKGVIVPHTLYSKCSLDALYDYTEGIMDLMLPDSRVTDHYGKPEMIFFGPDEGTAPLMDAVADRARQRGYEFWRTISTGKSIGIPHDTYGILNNKKVFGLVSKGEDGTELQINGDTVALTTDMAQIYRYIGGQIEISGMTTTSVMGAFRSMIARYEEKEEDLNLMMTGGPDGDLGSNQIQCYKGKICLIIDGGSVLFDPEGLDKEALMKIAFMRHTAPRMNSLAYPVQKLSKNGFQVPLNAKNVELPDGTRVEDGAVFHKNFITDIDNRKYIKDADIQAFIPCGGFKDTINHGNVRQFTQLFKELRFIVEGANVFFDDTSRRYIAAHTEIKQIKDSTANKGGVFSSAVAEVLTAFLMGDTYEDQLLNDAKTRWELIRNIITQVNGLAGMETKMILDLHEKDLSTPLFMLSETTSERIFEFQKSVAAHMDDIVSNEDLVWHVLASYIPKALIQKLGKESILAILSSRKLSPYRDAIITKKLASLAIYNHAMDWETYREKKEKNFANAMLKLFA